MLTREVKFLVESFWEGLRCDVMVPCIEPCGKNNAGTGLFEVEKLMTFKRQGMTMFPCMVSGCNQAQDIDALLRNAPAAAVPISLDYLEKKFAEVVNKMNYQGGKIMDRFDRVDDHDRRILSMADKIYTDLLQVLKDEAKEGPRLFSLVPVNRSGFNPKQWTSEKFKLILWCEHARKPLPLINGKDSQNGVYEIERTREWFVKAAPFLKIMTQALSLALPIATAGIKLEIDKAAYDFFADQITFSKEIIDATLSVSDKSDLWKDTGDSAELPQGFGIRAENATLRELHAFLKERDPGFGGLARVMNKRQEFLWVHEKFAGEY
jgi:hypothetical protein